MVGEMSRRLPPGRGVTVPAGASVIEDERHRVGGVRGVRAAGDRVDQHLGVAVVGSDQQRTAALLDRLVDAAQFAVDGFDGLDGRLELAGVPDHVRVGEVDDDHVERGVARPP